MLPSLGFQMQQTVPDCDFLCQNYCLISGVRKIGHVGKKPIEALHINKVPVLLLPIISNKMAPILDDPQPVQIKTPFLCPLSIQIIIKACSKPIIELMKLISMFFQNYLIHLVIIGFERQF